MVSGCSLLCVRPERRLPVPGQASGREMPVDDLLNHQLDFAKYCATLKTSSEISNVKKNVEKVAKTSFSDLKEESK